MDPNLSAILGALALLVRCGHTLHTMGAVRARSVAAVAARALIGTASIVLTVWLAGHAIGAMYDDPGTPTVEGPGVFVATPESFLRVLALSLLPAALVGGATAERARLRGLFLIVAFLTAVVLPALTAIGWYAASADVGLSLSLVSLTWPLIVGHLLAATAALTLARAIGPRAGKYNRDGSANFIPAHSLPILIAGDLLLIIGLPMLAAALVGDPAGRVVNAMLGGSAATLGAVLTVTLREGRVDIMNPWAGALAGVVAGSLCAPHIQTLPIVLGVIAGMIIPILSLKTDLKFRIDETSGLAIPHLLGGLAGAIGVGIGSALEGQGSIADAVVAGAMVGGAALAVVVVSLLCTLIPAMALRAAGWLRVPADAELEGLDLAQHDINAYPDFQQTMIKSYHLRQ